MSASNLWGMGRWFANSPKRKAETSVDPDDVKRIRAWKPRRHARYLQIEYENADFYEGAIFSAEEKTKRRKTRSTPPERVRNASGTTVTAKATVVPSETPGKAPSRQSKTKASKIPRKALTSNPKASTTPRPQQEDKASERASGQLRKETNAKEQQVADTANREHGRQNQQREQDVAVIRATASNRQSPTGSRKTNDNESPAKRITTNVSTADKAQPQLELIPEDEQENHDITGQLEEEDLKIADLGDHSREDSNQDPDNESKESTEQSSIISGAHEETEDSSTAPEYSFRDEDIQTRMGELQDQMEQFTHEYFNFEYRKKSQLPQIFERFQPETLSIIDNVASNGPGGQDTWKDIFITQGRRRALVSAIVSNVLVEQVFKNAFFGGDEKRSKRVNDKAEKYKDDFFKQSKKVATHVSAILSDPKRAAEKNFTLPSKFDGQVKLVAVAMQTHLQPIARVAPGAGQERNREMYSALHGIVTVAGILSLSMRMDPHTAYYFRPSSKDSPLVEGAMKIFNKSQIKQSDPKTPGKNKKQSEQEKRRAMNDERIVQITLLNGLTVYRDGGWETNSSEIWKPVYQDTKTKRKLKGYRERMLTEEWVLVRWGRPKGDDDGDRDAQKAVHGEAWKSPGFMPFRNVEGVIISEDSGGEETDDEESEDEE